MPTLKPETLRAYVFLREGKDFPADELSYFSDTNTTDGSDRPDMVRFHIVRHQRGIAEQVMLLGFALAGHSIGHVEREFIDSVAKVVGDAYAEKKAEFERLRDMVAAAGFPV